MTTSSIELARLEAMPRSISSEGPDPAAFEAAVGPLYASLLRRLVVVLGNPHDAEDVAQEAYLRAFRSWASFDGTDLRGWLYTIALRLAFNQLRSRRRRLAVLAGLAPRRWDDEGDPDLAAALGGLDPKVRSAIVLNAVDGYTQAEIARMLDVPEGTVASWISRGRAALRQALRPEAG
jgi:RNA polymerase sigma-70 factor, ECF subfamily